MFLKIKVITNARKNEIKQEGGTYKVYITALPVDGKANKKLVEFLAEHFAVKKSGVLIKTGEKSRYKISQINEQ